MDFSKLSTHGSLILETLQGILVQLAPSGRIRACQGRLEAGGAPDPLSLQGADWCGLFTPLDGEMTSREYLERVLLTSEHSHCINTVETRGGRRLILEWRFRRICTPSGRIDYLLGIGRPITRRLANESRLVAEHHRLVERNRELTCLYGISQVIVDVGPSFDNKLAAIAQLLLPALRYPARASAHIRLDEVSHSTEAFAQCDKVISEKVVVRGEQRGCVEAGYRLGDPPANPDELDFIERERQLLKEVALQLAFKLEKRELQAQLKHADRLVSVGQLAAGIAHELNNPLADILGFAQLAAGRPDLADETYQDLVRIVKSSLYAREVIKKILLFSRQSRPQQGDTDLNAIVREWLDFIEFRCAKSQIEVTVRLDPRLAVFQGDPAQLNQVLINLVINAIHAMPGGGRLTIRTGTRHDRVFLSVQDTGMGIKKEISEKIFLPFFTTKDVDQGTGLGLSVVYGIVQEHGGTVSVRSQEGQGSTFTIEFPLVAGHGDDLSRSFDQEQI